MPAHQHHDVGTWLAAMGLLVLAVCLLGLMAMVAPHLLGVILILGAFLGFGALHYVIWGWWLGSTLTKNSPDRPHDQDQ